MRERELEDRALHNVLSTLSQKYPDLYYENTNYISRLVYQYVHESPDISLEDQEILNELKVDDIMYKLSFKTVH
ncbi:MAG: hypothetical protein CME62_00680 [Halobacteriovoraceae bacterium]|nr:hypothetical protein [Halobacteriovoraceae bacterium]